MNTPVRTESAQIDPGSFGVLLANSTAIALAAIRAGRIVFATPAFQAEFHATGPVIGLPLRDLVPEADRERLAEALAAAEHAPTTYVGTRRLAPDAACEIELTLEATVLDGVPTIVAGASDHAPRDRTRQPPLNSACRDALTGLTNRTEFQGRLRQALLGAQRHRGMLAVLMANLDRLKPVNDRYGQNAGDIVLQLAGQHFRRCLRESDTLARLGDDDFAVLLPRLDDTSSAPEVARRMVNALADPLEMGTYQVAIGVSIGIALYPQHADAVEPLLAAADTALFRAKHAGRNQLQWATARFGADTLAVPPLSWSAARAVGIKAMDEQNCRLAGLFDTLAATLRQGADELALHAGLRDLVACLGVQFGAEERLMTDFQLAGFEQHHSAHQRLLEDIRNLDAHADLAGIGLTLRYLREWFLRHNAGPDSELGQALKANGCS
jgi:diguanylate cyclase (GGDEF)-like protein/hemerythrin-like metal-binding protein